MRNPRVSVVLDGHMPGAHGITPWWARAALTYERRLPNHRGKRFLLHRLYAWRGRSGAPIVARMKNGALLAVSPMEGLASHRSVGWTCLHEGSWEPHIERVLREFLGPGDTAYDVGANLGYFSAVMAQAVGESGHVAGFEPVPQTFERLRLCKELNGYSQLAVFRLAVGAGRRQIEIGFDPRLPGDASVHHRSDAQPMHAAVSIHTLDELLESGQLRTPSLIKIDVEGHELAVLQGARRILTAHRPTLVFEIHGTMSREAGWAPADVGCLLSACAPYRFFSIGDAEPGQIELAELRVPPENYVDVLALA